MKVSRRNSVVLLAGAALTLASILMFLYINSRSDLSESYTDSRDLIRQIMQKNSQWENEILKARIAITHNYDPLVSPLSEMTQLWQKFESMEAQHKRSQSTGWRTTLDAYLDTMKEKTRLVELFKSHNAVLRNSLAFLPTLEDDIQAQLSVTTDAKSQHTQNIATDTYDLLLSTLEFSQTASADHAASIQVGLNKLQINKERLGAQFHDPIDLLNNHISLILREQPKVNSLLEEIESVQVSERLDDITNMLNRDQKNAETIDQQYHFYMLLFSAALVILLIILAIRLIRSFAEISKINRALVAANDELERRVEERTRQLKDTQSELLDTARQAGMAEIATNVLHNVGNVLNSINISADLVCRKLRNSKAQGLGKAMQMLNEHTQDLGSFITEDEKGKLIPGYLNQLVDAIAHEQLSMAEELSQLNKSVDHIKDIVSTQQSYAGAGSLLESLSINDLLEDALRMNSGALTRHNVNVIREYADTPLIMGDKHRLLLILINLISNAKYAMSNVSNRERNMTLGVSIVDGETLQISVRDEGEGITAQNMSRIFVHGFTTRKEGHGFGLHSCALAAIEMNGRLNAYSDGPERGAVFVLQIPLKVAETPS